MNEERISLKVPDNGEVSAAITLPDDLSEMEGGVVIAHGQYNDMDHPLLKSFSKGLSARGYASIRFNFPYRERGVDSPDDMKVLMAALREARDELSGRTEAPIYLAGKSLGARIASYVAREDGSHGLIFLGYPIHPPDGDPAQYEQLLEIESPMVFFVGDSDPLCEVDKLHWVIEKLTAPTSIQIVSDGDHSFTIPEDDKRSQETIYKDIASVTADWLDEYGV